MSTTFNRFKTSYYFIPKIIIAIPLIIPCTIQAKDEVSLQSVVVTASRIAESVATSSAAITIISRQQIEASTATSLPEILSQQSGIDFSFSGGFGKNASMNIRGTSNKHVVTLIDGIKMGSATTGTTPFQHFPLDQIERIEIVKGARSGLYGADAIGGVIQIFTRKGVSGFSKNALVETGTHNTHRLSAGFHSGSESTQFSLQYAHNQSDNISARVGTNPDKDGYDNTSISIGFDHDMNKNLTAGVTFFQAEGNTEFDPFISTTDTNDTDFLQQTMAASLNWTPNDVWTSKLTIGQSRDKGQTHTNGLDDGLFNTMQNSISIQNDYTLNDHNTLVFGIDLTRDQVISSTNYTIDKRRNEGVFIQLLSEFFGNNFNLAIRSDDNDSFGEKTTGNVGWSRPFAKNWSLLANYGTAFKAPSFNDLFFPSTAFFASNPNLKPESSETVEIGIKANYNKINWNANMYQTEIKNLISFVTSPTTFFTNMVNVGKSKITGIETGLDITMGRWMLQTNISILNPENESTGKKLRRRASKFANVRLVGKLNKFIVHASVQASGRRFEDAENDQKLAGFALVNLRLDYKFTKHLTVSSKVNNVGNKKYQTVRNFNSLDQLFFVSLAYKD